VKDVEGNQYNVVKIGKQSWLKENLNVSKFRNGDPIKEAKSLQEWQTADRNKEPAWCCYNFDAANGKTYGKFYNCYAITDPRKIAPAGWHIPSPDEWVELDNTLGGSAKSGIRLRTDKVSEWKYLSQPDTVSGFEALSTGIVLAMGNQPFQDYGKTTAWWSSQKNGYSQKVHFINDKAAKMNDMYFGNGLPVRCSIGEAVDEANTVTHSNTTWMKSNLNVKTFKNGNPISQAKTAQEWIAAGKAEKPAWCYAPVLKGDSAYGILYNGYAIEDPRGLAPEGWVIPDSYRWTSLYSYNYSLIPDALMAAEMLKEQPGKHWDLQKTDEFYAKHPFSDRFEAWLDIKEYKKDAQQRQYKYYSNYSFINVLPSGRRLENGTFTEQGFSSYFWIYDVLDTMGTQCHFIKISIIDSGSNRDKFFFKIPAITLDRTDKSQGFSVRCIKKSTFVIAKP
jgi:uncharacterized protein (TIGR02145 family)